MEGEAARYTMKCKGLRFRAKSLGFWVRGFGGLGFWIQV